MYSNLLFTKITGTCIKCVPLHERVPLCTINCIWNLDNYSSLLNQPTHFKHLKSSFQPHVEFRWVSFVCFPPRLTHLRYGLFFFVFLLFCNICWLLSVVVCRSCSCSLLIHEVIMVVGCFLHLSSKNDLISSIVWYFLCVARMMGGWMDGCFQQDCV